jgi:hypothetical protein
MQNPGILGFISQCTADARQKCECDASQAEPVYRHIISALVREGPKHFQTVIRTLLPLRTMFPTRDTKSKVSVHFFGDTEGEVKTPVH